MFHENLVYCAGTQNTFDTHTFRRKGFSCARDQQCITFKMSGHRCESAETNATHSRESGMGSFDFFGLGEKRTRNHMTSCVETDGVATTLNDGAIHAVVILIIDEKGADGEQFIW